MILVIIGVLSALSYLTGIRAVLRGSYRPNVYSRIIWLLLAINGLAGVARLGNNRGTIILSLVQTLGSLLILLGALKYSILKFGLVECVSSLLLLVSGAIWLFGDYPAWNVAIGLIAHFIGALPTFLTVWRKPRSENTMFWAYFAVASLLAVATADKSHFENYMFSLYFGLFNTMMVGLSLRKTAKRA